MITNLDRRAAVFQAFRAYRLAQPSSPLRAAFLYADTIIQPVPLSREDREDIEILRRYKELKELAKPPAGHVPNCFSPDYEVLTARDLWAQARWEVRNREDR